MRRAFLALLLSFLLLGMQQAVAVHSFEHLGTSREQGATVPHEGAPCDTCELLASGTNGIPTSIHWTAATATQPHAAPVAFASRPVAAPAGYSPRAPPVLP